MLVVDASALVDVLTGSAPDPLLVARLADDGDLHAPHLVDVEILHALRRLTRSGALSEDRAHDARVDVAELALTRYPHEPLADRVWKLRDNVTAYDGVYVALAEALGVPLVTCDKRLASAPGLLADIELFAPIGE